MVTPEEIARAMAVHSEQDDVRERGTRSENPSISDVRQSQDTDEPTSDLSGNGKLPQDDEREDRGREDHERDAGHGVVGDVKKTTRRDVDPARDSDE
ncbi:MAG TPA: hypothetical protein VFX15_00495 [Actinomycetes bacterium]|nr:hypothetical protein [Actinomycetes bacterium]